jgi:hypothetical protein
MTTSTPRKPPTAKVPDALRVPGNFAPVQLILTRGLELMLGELAERNQQTDPLYAHAISATRRFLDQAEKYAPGFEDGDE